MNFEKSVEKAKGRLKKIQRADEKTKKRYLVILSFLAMIVVVGLWFAYLQATLPQPAPTAVGAPTEVGAAQENENSFFKTIGRGAKNIINNLENQFSELKDKFSRVKEFSIEGGGAEFTPSP